MPDQTQTPKKTKKSLKAKAKTLYGKIFNTELTTKAKLQVAALGILIAAIIAWVAYSLSNHGILYDFCAFLMDKEQVDQYIESMGIWGPVAFIGLQIAQTVISPIPGNIVGFIGGFLFGWWGILLSSLGCLIGYYIVLKVSRKLGRSFVEKVVSKELMQKFDYLIGEKGVWVFFLIFLLPALPDDAVIYIAGLTKLPIATILFLATVGRLPTTVITNQFGMGLSEKDPVQISIITAFTLIVVGLCLWKRKEIMAFINKQSSRNKARAEKVTARVKTKIKSKIPHRRGAKAATAQAPATKPSETTKTTAAKTPSAAPSMPAPEPKQKPTKK